MVLLLVPAQLSPIQTCAVQRRNAVGHVAIAVSSSHPHHRAPYLNAPHHCPCPPPQRPRRHLAATSFTAMSASPPPPSPRRDARLASPPHRSPYLLTHHHHRAVYLATSRLSANAPTAHRRHHIVHLRHHIAHLGPPRQPQHLCARPHHCTVRSTTSITSPLLASTLMSTHPTHRTAPQPRLPPYPVIQ